MKSIFLVKSDQKIKEVYGGCIFDGYEELKDLDMNAWVNREQLMAHPEKYNQVEYIFSTWYMPILTREEIDSYLPNLKAVFYAAGTCKYFAEPYLGRGVRVFAAKGANSIPVAEYTVSQILLANKGYYQAQARYKHGCYKYARKRTEEYVGNYGCKIGIIGAGAVGTKVIELLRPYNVQVIVYDPFLSEEKRKQLNVASVGSVLELFEQCDVVSNHLPDIPSTTNMLDAGCFSKMKKNATFINTGRGAQVIERDLIKVLWKRKDLSAVLDVSRHEPLLPLHPFYWMKNVFLTPHIAGSIGQEQWRMAEEMLRAYEDLKNGKPNDSEIKSEMLKHMA